MRNLSRKKKLGKLILPAVLNAIDQDTDNTVFLIFLILETSFYGLVEEAQDFLNQRKIILSKKNRDTLTTESLRELAVKIRTEKVAIKDAKLRTFITEDSSRDDLVAHVYDVTYGLSNLLII
jgi:amidophosphoribosyltransferase